MGAEHGVWVKTSPTVDGSEYVVTIEADDDRARVLTMPEALAYASEVMRVCAVARHESGVLRQLLAMDLGMEVAAGSLIDLRAARPAFEPHLTAPITLTPGVSALEHMPFLIVRIDGEDEPVGQWTCDDAEEHAMNVISAVAYATLDTAYFTYLTDTAGTTHTVARNAIENIGEYLYWPATCPRCGCSRSPRPAPWS